jgi:hypothetical protein
MTRPPRRPLTHQFKIEDRVVLDPENGHTSFRIYNVPPGSQGTVIAVEVHHVLVLFNSGVRYMVPCWHISYDVPNTNRGALNLLIKR